MCNNNLLNSGVRSVCILLDYGAVNTTSSLGLHSSTEQLNSLREAATHDHTMSLNFLFLIVGSFILYKAKMSPLLSQKRQISVHWFI
jgi:hypothetical protein